jgi:hypothetical protein
VIEFPYVSPWAGAIGSGVTTRGGAGVAVGDRVGVVVGVGDGVGEDVGVGEGVAVGDGVGVLVEVGVAVGTAVEDGVSVCVGAGRVRFGGVLDAGEPQAEFENVIKAAKPNMTKKAAGTVVKAIPNRLAINPRSLLRL